MDSEVLKPLTRLHSLTLDGNDWKCDCRLRQLRQFLMMTRRLSVYDEPKCSPSSSPSSQTIWTQMGEKCLLVFSLFNDTTERMILNSRNTSFREKNDRKRLEYRERYKSNTTRHFHQQSITDIVNSTEVSSI